MAVTQSFKPPFAATDVDTVQMDFAAELGSGETISTAAVSAASGFTFAAAEIGSIADTGIFSVDAAGTVVQALATAGSTTGSYQIVFTITTSTGRTLHRTVRCDIAPRS